MFLWNTSHWFMERAMMLLAGGMLGISIVLTVFVSIYWLIMTSLISLLMIVFALTGFCPSALVLDKLGFKSKYERT